MRTALKVLALGVAIATSATMAKADTLYYNIIYTGTSTCTTGCSIGSGSSTTGTITNSSAGFGYGFTVALDAQGSPAQNAPNFSTVNFDIEGANRPGGTLTIEVSDTGLTSPSGVVLNTFGTNNLGDSSFQGGTIANYYDTTNTTFGTGTELASANFTGVGGFVGPIDAALTVPGVYSETTIYTLNFGALGDTSGNITANASIAAATPEPSSLALLGTSLLGAAGVARRRFMKS